MEQLSKVVRVNALRDRLEDRRQAARAQGPGPGGEASRVQALRRLAAGEVDAGEDSEDDSGDDDGLDWRAKGVA